MIIDSVNGVVELSATRGRQMTGLSGHASRWMPTTEYFREQRPGASDRTAQRKGQLELDLSNYNPQEQSAACGSAINAHSPRTPLYSRDYAANPHRVYQELRDIYGSLAPVELAPGLPATLVLDSSPATGMLATPDRFLPAPTMLQQTACGDGELLPPIARCRPNAPRATESEQVAYRFAAAAVIRQIDLDEMQSAVEQIAPQLVKAFSGDGHADLISQYALPLSFGVINSVLGCPPELGDRISTGISAIFDGVDAADGKHSVVATFLELIRRKRVQPEEDVTTRLINGAAALADEELSHQVALFYSAGIQPMQTVLIDTLRLMLADDRFAGRLHEGNLTPLDALDEALFTEAVISTHCVRYPREPVLINGLWLPAHQPVVIGVVGSDDDTAVSGGEVREDRLRLCPAQDVAYVIVQEAIYQLLDALPDMKLAVPSDELTWRPRPFHRSLSALPVVFPNSLN
jgi:hypothetical protein